MLPDGRYRICESTPDGIPVCQVFEMMQAGGVPNPNEWWTDEDPANRLPGPYPLEITCPDCLEVIHA